MLNRSILVAFVIGLVVPGCLALTSDAFAQSQVEQLQNEIKDRGDRLTDIDVEIAKYEAELLEVGAEKKTLQGAINRLETERKKVNAEISKTSALITSTDLEINKLILEIGVAEDNIATAEATISDLIRSQYRANEQSVLEIILKHDKLSDFMREVDTFQQVKNSMATHVATLDQMKELLEERRDQNEDKRSELASLKGQYEGQNEVLVVNKTQQSQLLSATKNEESNYQALLAERREARARVAAELLDFESKLQFILDPNTIPAAGTPVFAWPTAVPIVTQRFGGTEFAARRPGYYGGRSHPGVDFRAAPGTPILAPLTGTVRAVGNTDAVPGCASWGKWIFVDHPNGLSTFSTHLNVISVSPGQRVTTGEIIGYSGTTGLIEGPHLHFGLHVSEGTEIMQFNQFKTSTSCGPATTPVAATSAKLDPLDYLPPATFAW